MFPNLSAGAIRIKATLSETIKLAADNGFAGIDFSITEAAELADAHGIDSVKELFAAANVRPGVWGFPVNYREDEATWQQGLDDLPRLAKLAQALGCDRTATWILPSSKTLPFQENFDFHVARLGPAAQILSDHGCRFGLEFVGPKTTRPPEQHDFVYTLDGMLELGRAINPDNTGLLLDAYHLYTSHGTVDDVLKLSNRDVVVVHVNDAPAGIPIDEQMDLVRALPAETGVIDIAGFMGALVSIGYDGPVTVEPFSERVQALPAAEAARETAESLRRIWLADEA